MIRLYFSACSCNFINVSESNFNCLHLSRWLSQTPSPSPPCPVTASSSVQLSLAKLHLLWEAFLDTPGYLAPLNFLNIYFMPLILHLTYCGLIIMAHGTNEFLKGRGWATVSPILAQCLERSRNYSHRITESDLIPHLCSPSFDRLDS